MRRNAAGCAWSRRRERRSGGGRMVTICRYNIYLLIEWSVKLLYGRGFFEVERNNKTQQRDETRRCEAMTQLHVGILLTSRFFSISFPQRDSPVNLHDISEIRIMGISYYLIKHFGLPLTHAYATLRQSVAGNSTFRGIVFCNLGTSKTVISNFVTSLQMRPHIFPHIYGHPNNVPVGQKNVEAKKKSASFLY